MKHIQWILFIGVTTLSMSLLGAPVAPQQGLNLHIQQITSDNGLPDNDVRSLAIDQYGFLWLGTPNGLYRYDGNFYTTYRYDPETDRRFMHNNHINAIKALQNGLVMIRVQGNRYALFDPDTERFIDNRMNGQDPVMSRYREVDSLLWLWEDGGAALSYRWQDGALSVMAHHSSDVPRVEQSGKGVTRAQELVQRGAHRNLIWDNRSNPCVLDDQGRLWWIDRETGRTVELQVFDPAMVPLVSSRKYNVATSPDGRYTWVSTNGCGLTLYDHSTGKTEHIRSKQGGLATDYLIAMVMDDDGNIIVADDAHGIECIALPPSNYQSILLDAQATNFRSNRASTVVPLDSTRILVANPIGRTYVLDTAMQLHPLRAYDDIDVHCASMDAAGQLWVGTRQRGLISPKGMSLMHDPADPTSIASNNIMGLFCDRDGRMWVCNYFASLDLMEQEGDRVRFRHFFPDAAGFRVVIQDRRGMLWAGGRDGLRRFDPATLVADPSAYTTMLKASDTQYSDVSDIMEDSKGRIWVSSLGGGVWCFDEQRPVRHLTTQDGLLSDDIRSIVESEDGEIWIGTARGITCYKPEDGTLEHRYDNFNLLRNIHTDNAAIALSNGRLLFGTDEGLTLYDTRSPAQASHKALRVTGVYVNGVPYSALQEETVAADRLEELKLQHNQNTLIIRYSAFNYHAPAGTYYRCQLEGYEKNWSNADNTGQMIYRNLPPGHYTFHVRVYANNIMSSERVMHITITRPWWKTWWAILLYIVVLGGFAWATIHQTRILYGLRHRVELEKQLSDYKSLFFTNISHEFRTPLTIIQSSIERMVSMDNIPPSMVQPVASLRKSTERMLRLINQLLAFRMAQSGTLQLQLERMDVMPFLREIYYNFQSWAETRGLEYTFSFTKHHCNMPLDKQCMDKVVYNLISNAIKYTPQGGHVHVAVGIEGEELVLRVEDNGVGIEPDRRAKVFDNYMHTLFESSNSSGIGLHFTKTLVELHHGTISYASNEPSGSIFTVRIPMNESAYAPSEYLTEKQKKQQEILQTPSMSENEKRRMDNMIANGNTHPLNERYVLVVDDDYDLRNYMISLLQPYFHVLSAEDGVQAWDIVQKQKPDMVISDVVMSALNGYELCRRIRNDEASKSLPVLLLSALASDDKRIAAFKAGADAYMVKPFNTQVFITTCQSLLQRHDQLRQSYAGEVVEKREALPEIMVDERDRQFLKYLDKLIMDNIASPALSIEMLCEKMKLGRTMFFRRVKSLTGMTPADYIRTVRLRYAAELLMADNVTVAEVSYKVGIDDPHYFIKLFKHQYGITPKKYQQGQKISE